MNNLIKSLSKAKDCSNDESYSKVAIDLEIASSALQSEQADCTNLKECTKLIALQKSRSISSAVAKRHLVFCLLKFSRSIKRNLLAKISNLSKNFNFDFNNSNNSANMSNTPNQRQSHSVPPPNSSYSPQQINPNLSFGHLEPNAETTQMVDPNNVQPQSRAPAQAQHAMYHIAYQNWLQEYYGQ